MSVLNQIGEEQVECPLCMEPLEVDDLNFFPCTCGYQICRFCWHRIRTDGNGLCPACRKAYPEDPADFKPLTQEEVAKLKAEKRQKDIQRKQRITENRKHLANVRVVQRNLVFVVGLPMRLADAETLKKHEYFGKFGKIHKVVINQSTSYAGSQGPSASAYVTYQRSDDALRAIQAVNNIAVDGRTVKTSLGTTKYCSHFLKNQPCPKADCMYLHELGDPDASFTKEEMQQGKHQEYEKKLHEQLIANTLNRKPTPSPPTLQVSSQQPVNKEAWPSLNITPNSSVIVGVMPSSSPPELSSTISTSNNNRGETKKFINSSKHKHRNNTTEERRSRDVSSGFTRGSDGSGWGCCRSGGGVYDEEFVLGGEGEMEEEWGGGDGGGDVIGTRRGGGVRVRGGGIGLANQFSSLTLAPSSSSSSNSSSSSSSLSSDKRPRKGDSVSLPPHQQNNHHRPSSPNHSATPFGERVSDPKGRANSVSKCVFDIENEESPPPFDDDEDGGRRHLDILDFNSSSNNDCNGRSSRELNGESSGGVFIDRETTKFGSNNSRKSPQRYVDSNTRRRGLQIENHTGKPRPQALFEPDNNSFFSSNFSKINSCSQGNVIEWPVNGVTCMPDALPQVNSTEDWQAAFGFPHSRGEEEMNGRDDDLGFDPFHETQKALAEMIEKEEEHRYQPKILMHHNIRLANCSKLLEGLRMNSSGTTMGNAPPPQSSTPSPRPPPPPPGFASNTTNYHMNAFGLGIPRTGGSKALPFVHPPFPFQSHSLPQVWDWPSLDPAIVTSAQHCDLYATNPPPGFSLRQTLDNL